MVDAVANQPSVRLFLVEDSKHDRSERDLHVVLSYAFDAHDLVRER